MKMHHDNKNWDNNFNINYTVSLQKHFRQTQTTKQIHDTVTKMENNN